MKQCPKCRQLCLPTQNLRICRFDSFPLISEATPPKEAATILFSIGHLNNRFTPLDKLRRRK